MIFMFLTFNKRKQQILVSNDVESVMEPKSNSVPLSLELIKELLLSHFLIFLKNISLVLNHRMVGDISLCFINYYLEMEYIW